MSTLAITYRKNPKYSDGTPEEPRLFGTIDLGRYGVSTQVAALPIYFRQLDKPAGPMRVAYSTRVAGLLLERGNLESLVTVLDSYIGALVRFERLPEYVFHVGSNAWPIYRLPGQLVTRYPGGPVFSAPDIGELRIWLADHFRQLGRIQSRRELGILYLSQSDLQLYPPDFALRSPSVPDIPVFPIKNDQEDQLLAPVNSQSIVVPLNEGAEVFDLHQEVSEYLFKRGRLGDPYDMTVRKLAAHVWARAKATLVPHAKALVYYTEVDGRLCDQDVPVFTNGRNLIAAQANRLGRMSIFLGADIRGLQLRLGAELYHQGTINSPDAVRTVSAQREKPASMLDHLLRASVYS